MKGVKKVAVANALEAVKQNPRSLRHVPLEFMMQESCAVQGSASDQNKYLVGMYVYANGTWYPETSSCKYDAATKHLYFILQWPHSSVRVRSWSEGCRVDMEESGGWKAKADAVDLPVADALLTGWERDHPIARYTHELPQDIVRDLASFGNGQLAMLQVCAISPRGAQLLRSAPVLFWLVAPVLLRESGAEPEALHTLLGLKARDLLALHCGHGSNALIRLLAKVPISATHMDKRILNAILLREEASTLLRHKANVDWQLLELIVNQGDKISNPLVRSIIMSNMEQPAMAATLDKMDSIVRDTMHLGQQLGIADAAGLVATCTDWRMLWGLHEAWTKRLNSVQLDATVRKYGETLPPPPLPGTDAIQPIDSVRELLLEGRIMHHCVGSYIDDVRSGTYYVYRVMEPERATLAIWREASGIWVQGELKSYCDKKPGMAVDRQVQEWLTNSACKLAKKAPNGNDTSYAEYTAQKLRDRAVQGDAVAQCLLGIRYAEGRGVPQDDCNAVDWFQKAADQGDKYAQYELGCMYADGRGVSQDDCKAVKWLQQAADQGDAVAQYELGFMYAHGRGVSQDDCKAVEWLQQAADQGYATAQYTLGYQYAEGCGVPRDDCKAVEWFRKSADQGYADARTALEEMYAVIIDG
jgi:hypothetical protein